MSKKSKKRKIESDNPAENAGATRRARAESGKKTDDQVRRFTPPSEKKKLAIKITAIATAVVVLFITILIVFTPIPSVLKKKIELSKSPEKMDGDAKAILASETSVTADVSYNSAYKKGFMDIYRPRDNDKTLPMLIWVHGGAYSGGDKVHTEYFCRTIAKKGYAVIAINYALLPASKYPEPIIQLGEAYKFLRENGDKYKVDYESVFIGGDSAGAQIAAQFGNIQANSAYGNQFNMNAVMKSEHLKGLFLFSGIYDFTNLDQYVKSEGKFELDRICWSYFGERNWRKTDNAKFASIINYVTSAFPPTFISDGAKSPLNYQSDAFVKKLQQYDVQVTKMLFSDSLDTEFKYVYDLESDDAVLAVQQVASQMYTILNGI